eukprot:CAMPEP_0116891976 /NCGR_PEP_ID=MMETSP0467-20121206/2287_1 /TAXON_ID=283647 /ORGANISM="Mesodinium pulex, Strain SPMC105" /LENGTH=50 /DNA_ID=CAMNT_0004560819 /DNA_START=1430 /DNA_END=1582 /DNA_ORIENTATION=+
MWGLSKEQELILTPVDNFYVFIKDTIIILLKSDEQFLMSKNNFNHIKDKS